MEAPLEIASRVLYEDNHLVLVNKLPGEIVQGDKTGDMPLSDLVKDYLKVKYDKPGEAFLGTVHRIDRPVSGAVIYAKTSKALERMNALLRERQLQKTYWAVVKHLPSPPQGHVGAWLKKNEKQNKSYGYKKEVPGALFSELDYEVIASSDRYHLLHVSPITGRHHQIRVLLALLGSPIKGDLKYGSDRSNRGGSIHLHAREVQFTHPVSKNPVHVIAPVPDEPLWKFFEELGARK